MTHARSSIETGIAANVSQLPAWQTARLVLGYAALRDEPDLLCLLERAWQEGKTVALPRCAAPGVLAWHRVCPGERLARGAYGIREPASTPTTLIDPRGQGTLALVPGLAFDLHGNRLGYGGGYYDRLLPGLAGCTVGVCPDALLVDDLAAHGVIEGHDAPVDFVATERRVVVARP